MERGRLEHARAGSHGRRRRPARLILANLRVAARKRLPTPLRRPKSPENGLGPCCKPLALCVWLATLILPPPRETPRRILVPFAGRGSEMLGALMAGWRSVVGIEREPAYCDVAKRRIEDRKSYFGISDGSIRSNVLSVIPDPRAFQISVGLSAERPEVSVIVFHLPLTF